jgi:phosphohistidine swiveling domain-containing protein
MTAQPLVSLGSKAVTLDTIRPLLTRAVILPVITVVRRAWADTPEFVLDLVVEQGWDGELIVRSSASAEDTTFGSGAGRFHTEDHVVGRNRLRAAIDRVFGSYDLADLCDGEEHVLVQPMVTDAVVSGVASGRDHVTGGPYRVVNWSSGPDTAQVTSGRSPDVRTWYGLPEADTSALPLELQPLIPLLDEIEELVGDGFEIEFAVSASLGLVLFQLRSFAGLAVATVTARQLLQPVRDQLAEVIERSRDGRTARPLAGGPTVLGAMPDWNPAEMIGTRPRRLAASIYCSLITDEVWARARVRYGYRDVTGTPLLVDLGGIPLVDVRASAASLVPADVPPGTAGRLVDHYVSHLADSPHLHDKFEFEVTLSAWTPGAADWIESNLAEVLDLRERELLSASLSSLTDDIVAGARPWKADLRALRGLELGRERARALPAGSLERIDALLDCTRVCGTLPFAGLARAAFVATQILYQAVGCGAVTSEARDALLGQASAVTSGLVNQLRQLSCVEFLARYGYLRPGTYDILSPRYDEQPDRYLGAYSAEVAEVRATSFEDVDLDLGRLDAALAGCGLGFDADTFGDFALCTVHGREVGKLEFTRNLSDALVDLGVWGESVGLSRDDVSHLRIDDILAGPVDPVRLREQVAEGREEHSRALTVVLPPLLRGEEDVWSFEMPANVPNFITRRRALAKVADVAAGDDPTGCIAFIPSADPGYDWIFARGVAGLVTAYGGVNSHMAIRAREFDLPAVTGVGEARYKQWVAATEIELDAGSQIVRVVR